jgi:F-type H+-transporting ATPase subunit alpha
MNEILESLFAAPVRPRWIEPYRFALRVTEQGSILSIGDGIARVTGLPSAAMEDILEFEDGSRAVVFAIDRAGG